MFAWLERKAAKRQETNIRQTLKLLIEVANDASATIDRTLNSTPKQRARVHELQEQLLLDFIGPIPLDEIKTRILEPALQSHDASRGARLAVEHVYDTASTSQNR